MSFLQIQSPVRWIFLLHAVFGIMALALLLIPLLSKKGSRIHIWSGWAYTISMAAVAISSYVISPWRIFFDPEGTGASRSFAIFLFFIATLTFAALWNGLI